MAYLSSRNSIIMTVKTSKGSLEMLKLALTEAVVRICKDYLKFVEFVHVTGQLSFFFDDNDKLDIAISELIASDVSRLSRQLSPGSIPSPLQSTNIQQTKGKTGTGTCSEIVVQRPETVTEIISRALNGVTSRDYLKSEKSEASVFLDHFSENNQIFAPSSPELRSPLVHLHNQSCATSGAGQLSTLPEKCGDSKSFSTGIVHHHEHPNSEISDSACDTCHESSEFSNSHLLNHTLTDTHLKRHYADHCEVNLQEACICDENFESSVTPCSLEVESVSTRPFVCAQCGECFRTQKLMRLHEKCHFVVKPLVCQMCNRTFKDKYTLAEHVKTIHTAWSKCAGTDCGKMCNCASALHSRTILHGNSETLQFSSEKSTGSGHAGRMDSLDSTRTTDILVTAENSGIISHVKMVVERDSVRPNMEVGGFEGILAEDITTLKSSPPVSPYEHCKAVNHNSHHVYDKQIVSCDNRRYHCNLCDKNFNFYSSMKLHMLRHEGQRPYRCHACSKSYLTATHLKYHFQAVHEEVRPFQCTTCRKTFPYENSLRLHSRLHTGERPFVCTFCGKTFVSKSALRSHSELHSDVAAFACDICSKTFRTPVLLREHRRRHTSDRIRFVCHVCGHRFMYQSTLRAHYAIHGEERSYECDRCDKKFKTYAGLYSHKQVHLLTSQFVCMKCGKSFKTKKHLKAHEKRHFSDRPFVCQLCQKSFLDKGTLTKHVKTIHATWPKYVCPACNKICNRMDNLRCHMRVHGDARLLELPLKELILPEPVYGAIPLDSIGVPNF